MTALLIGYARCSTDQQDLSAQRDGLAALGVAANPVYVDHGLTGTNRERPGLREALATCPEGGRSSQGRPIKSLCSPLSTVSAQCSGTRKVIWRPGPCTPLRPRARKGRAVSIHADR